MAEREELERVLADMERHFFTLQSQRATVQAEIRSAEEVARDALQRAEAARRTAEELLLKESAVRDVVDGLRVLVGRPVLARPPEAPTGSEILDLRTAETGATDLRPGPRRRPAASSSSVRARKLLQEVGRALSSSELVEGFRQRGWIQDSWEVPEAAVHQAARRAVSWGWLKRLPDGRFALADEYAGRSDVIDLSEAEEISGATK